MRSILTWCLIVVLVCGPGASALILSTGFTISWHAVSGMSNLNVAMLLTWCLLIATVCAPDASAALPSAGFTISSDAVPTVFTPEHNGIAPSADYTLTVVNAGMQATDGTPISIVDVLPPGVSAVAINGAEVQEIAGEGAGPSCELASLTCVYNHALQPGETLRINIAVRVAPGALESITNSASVAGGGAPTVSTVESNKVGSAVSALAVPFGFSRFGLQVTGANGLTDAQAGDHPYEATVSYAMNSAYNVRPPGLVVGEPPYVTGGVAGFGGSVKDTVVDLPAGFVGNPEVVAKCPEYKVGIVPVKQNGVVPPTCPPDTQIGVATVYSAVAGLTGEGGLSTGEGNGMEAIETVPIFNMIPDKGYPAQFALEFGGRTVTLYVTVDQETNYGVRVIVHDIPSAGNVVGVSATFFGTPVTDPHIDNQLFGTATPQHEAFLDNPASCAAGPQVTKIAADTWQHPGQWTAEGAPVLSDPNWATAESTTFPSIAGCNMLQFNPAIEVLPDTTQADEPTGLTVHLHVPQGNQEAPLLVTPSLEDATVTLPDGLSVSPSAADGLQGCTDAEINLQSRYAGSCPLASEIGTVKIVTPLLSNPLEGRLFLGMPGCNPCSNADAADGNMLHIFLEAEGAGVVIKQRGTVYANPATGQLTTTFTGTPQVPFSDLYLSFKGGLRAALATPQGCGTFVTTSDFTPWSSPITADADPVSPFNIDWDGNGGTCPTSLPFAPSFSAGTSNPNAGQFSPLTVTFNRGDREQDMAGIQVKTPPGLLGILSSVSLCGEPQASLGTCAAGSRIGSMTVAAGPGSHPFYTQGSLYLTGPYKGAPFGLSIVVPTVAGPFNLGNVVVRARVNIDPTTAALTVTSDPLPQIIDGIPLRLRTANVTVDRPNFIFNPSNCAQQQITTSVSGAQGAVENTSAPFAVSGCAGLHFGPKFSASTSGKTSRANGASLDAKLVYPSGAQSNITRVKVDLPKQLPSRLTTLQKACPAATFDANPASCPSASVVGIVRATTPVLPVGLTGPVYFVSHANEAFPDLVAVLQGYGVRINLVGTTFISKKGITSSTFKNVPDVPVSSFELYLPEGAHSALAANGNLCTSSLTMPTAFIAQDGAELKQSTKIAVTSCTKAKKVAKKKAKAKKAQVDDSVGHGTKVGRA
jgi:hypothetical protein